MSTRSKREHKPTSKFLKYYNDELCSNKTLRKSLSKNDTPPPVTNKKRKIEIEEITSKKSISETPTKRMKYEASTSSEVRRSGRQAKPNVKLNVLSQVSLNSSEESEHTLSEDQGKKLLKPSLIEDNNLKIVSIKGKVGKSKNIATISPVLRPPNTTTPVISTKHLTIGLSDCVINVSRVAIKRQEMKGSMDCNEVNKSTLNGNDNSKINPSDKFYGKMRMIVKNNKSRAGVIGKVGPITGKVIKNSDSNKKVSDSLNSVATKSDTCDASPSTASSTVNPIRFARNKLVENKVNVTIDKPQNTKKIRLPYTNKAFVKPFVKSAVSNIKNKSTPTKTLDTRLSNVTTTMENKPQDTNSPPKDMKDTLQKFLLMGHKVANAISETLKTNEAELLSKSSTFEKKCINLIQSVAHSSTDISEEDMETILKCLDEEQEERRSYRRTFLESLRVAHLTNMALYSQMIRVLHTL